MRAIDHIVIHHSASPLWTTWEHIDRWHRAPPNNYARIGYHFVIDQTGYVNWCRDPQRIGAHAYPHNRRSLGICVVGDNTTIDQRWVEQQIVSLRVLASLCTSRFTDAVVLGHRDVPDTATECPGLDVRALLGLDPL